MEPFHPGQESEIADRLQMVADANATNPFHPSPKPCSCELQHNTSNVNTRVADVVSVDEQIFLKCKSSDLQLVFISRACNSKYQISVQEADIASHLAKRFAQKINSVKLVATAKSLKVELCVGHWPGLDRNRPSIVFPLYMTVYLARYLWPVMACLGLMKALSMWPPEKPSHEKSCTRVLP